MQAASAVQPRPRVATRQGSVEATRVAAVSRALGLDPTVHRGAEAAAGTQIPHLGRARARPPLAAGAAVARAEPGILRVEADIDRAHSDTDRAAGEARAPDSTG